MNPGPSSRSGGRRWVSALALVAWLPSTGAATEVLRTEAGAVLELSGFYKSFLSGMVLQPNAVRSARDLAALMASPASIPSGGAVTAHLLRVGSRFRFLDKMEFEVAAQSALSFASDPVFAGTAALSGTVAGAGAPTGAQRRLVELGGVIAQGSTGRMDLDLDRFALKVPLSFGDLTLGRQVLSWGTGRFWNPTDVLSPFPPTAVDREIRRGFDAVRLAVALGEVTQLDVLYLPQWKPEDNGAVVRFQTNVSGWDGSLSIGKYVRDVVLGADLVGDLGPIGVHAEGAYTAELQGLGTSNVSVREQFFRGVVGADARPLTELLVMVEYAFNGYGTTDPARYAAVLSSPRVVRGELFGAGKHQAAVAVSYLAHDLLSAQLSTLVNLTDPSAMLIPSLEYGLTQTVLIRAGASLPLGKTPDPNVYAGLTPADVSAGTAAYREATASRGLRSEYGSSSFNVFIQVGFYLP